MRHQGKITKWMDDKGFGFIAQDGSKEQAFVHISGFERGQERPQVGEIVSYEVANDVKKGLQAYKVKYVNRPVTRTRTSRRAYRPKDGVNLFKWIGIIALVVISSYLYKKVSLPRLSQTYEQQSVGSSSGQRLQAPTSQSFRCAGKTRCNEMLSCDEAMFYLNNCPGTIADSDIDGIPCEDQWCGH